MKKSLVLIQMLTLCMLLATLTPARAQMRPTDQGYDGDQAVKSSQRDNEDHETSFQWVGAFGLLGAVGLVGSKRINNRSAGAVNLLLVSTTVLILSSALWTLTPAFAQSGQEASSTEAPKSDIDRSAVPDLGWIGLLGLVGLLGLRRGRQTTEGGMRPGNAVR